MDLTRRSVLVAGSVSGLVACTPSRPHKKTPEDPDVALLAEAVSREQALLATYVAARVTAPLVSDVTAHLARLAAPDLTRAGGTPTPSSTGAPPVNVRPAALARATSDAHAAAAVAAGKALAPVLASLAACAATHAAVL